MDDNQDDEVAALQAAKAAPGGDEGGRQIVVCGAEGDDGRGFLCILPPDHVEHTTSPNGVTWHKTVNNRGNGMAFATTPPGHVSPKLSDMAGLFEGYADHVEPGMPEEGRYYVGYYCPRGNGHWELVGNEDYTRECGSKGWDLYLDGATPGDAELPPGEWV